MTGAGSWLVRACTCTGSTLALLAHTHQWLRSYFNSFPTKFMFIVHRTEIKPGKHSDIRIKPLPMTNNGHDRYITAHPNRHLCLLDNGRYKNLVTVSILKPPVSILKPPSGGFRSETAPAWSPGSRNGLKNPLELLESSVHNSFPRRRRRAWV